MSVARSGSLPADSLLGSPMEFSGQPRPSCNLLGVPGLSSLDVDDDEGEFVIGIRPKSSPLPRRRSSLSEEDLELEPPLSGSRRVLFADAVGLDLVQVKEFDIWDVPKLPDYDSSEGRETDSEEYFISPSNFSLPLPLEELFAKVRDQKVELETVELLPGTTILRGVIRVLNVSFDKAVYVRTSLDSWSSHFDLLAEYIPGSSEGLMDCFSFRLTLVPPFREQGARVDFCLRYETPVGMFWANNESRNYTLFCQRRAKEEEERPQRGNMKRKSCLKMVGQNFSSVENISALEDSRQENNKTDVSKRGEEETLKVKEAFADQSGTSEGGDQLLPTKSRRSCSRRSRRKAARMARVRDYFSQRNGADDPERDGSPSEAQREQNPDVKSVSESQSDVLQETSPPPARDDSSNNRTEKPESVDLSDSLRGGESASDTPNNILQSRDEPPSAENQDMSRSGSEAEDASREGRRHSADEPLDGLVSSSESFTFGTVVAPLYRQAFVSSDRGDSSLNVDDERRESTAQQDAGDSIHKSPEASHTGSIDGTSLERPDQRWLNSLHAPKTLPAEAEKHPNPAGILRTDVSDTLNLAESSELRGEEQEKDLTPDLQHQTTAETQVQTNADKTNERLDPLKSSESGCLSPETEQEACEEEEDETANDSRAIVTSEDDKPLKDSAPQETLESSDSRPETSEGKDEKTRQGSLQTQEEVDARKQEDVMVLSLAEAAEAKNWEMMVEEDEMNLLTDEEEEISIQAGDIEAVEEDDIEQFEDVGRETASERKDATVEEDERREEDETEEEQVEDQDEETREDPEETERDGVEVEEEEHVEGNEDEESRGDEGLDGETVEDGERVAVCFEERSEEKEEDGLPALSDVEERRVNGREDGEFQTQQAAPRDLDGSSFADHLDVDQTSDGSASSDSDDEVELYMHCLRAVHTGPQANKDSGFGVGRRPSVNRSKLLSTPMPSISESVDEDQNLGDLQETLTETGEYEFTAAESQQENIRPVSWWRETFSCRNMGKAFLYAALFLIFLVVAHHYDFLACFGLYLMSLVWLWFQGERQKASSSKRIS